MGTLLSLLGSIGIISSGVGTAASATAVEDMIVDQWLSTIPKYVDLDVWLELTAAKTNFVAWLENQIAVENALVLDWLAADSLAVAETATLENGILVGSLGTAAETLGISLAIEAVIYGGYYAYHHWDNIKYFTSESVKTVGHYI